MWSMGVTLFLMLSNQLPFMAATQELTEHRILNQREPLPRSVRLPLDGQLPAGGTRREFLRASLGPEGVVPIEERDSSALAALSRADVLIDRPIDAPDETKGALVPCYLLRNGAIS